jgi:hypothetical protein
MPSGPRWPATRCSPLSARWPKGLRTGRTATVRDCNLMLRDHFDCFVLTGDPERPAVPI